jgi:hypothetical protein
MSARIVWLVHETRDYDADTVYVFDSETKAIAYVAENADRYPDDPYQAVVE